MTRPWPRAWLLLIAVGLLLRLPGLLVGGMADVYEFILDWGADVRALGLGPGFSINYGALSFACFGLVARLAEEIPRFWWLPYKGAVIVSEAAVLAALLHLSPKRMVPWVLFGFWCNPWFIMHGAYQGFWDGAHLAAALGAVVVVRRWPSAAGWATAGALLLVSWQFKPQGLIHFAAPVGLWLGLVAWRGQRLPLLVYAAGFVGAAAMLSLALALTGGSLLALLENFRSSSGDARWSNGGVSIWRFAAFVYMQAQGIPGEVHTLRLPLLWLGAGTVVAAGVTGGVLFAIAKRLANDAGRGGWPSAAALYVMLAAGALVVSQFGTRAHINHSHGALVLLLPLLAGHRGAQVAWVGAVAIQAVAHVARYGLGAAVLLPPDHVIERYGHAGAIADAVRTVPAATSPDAILRIQAATNEVLAALPGPGAVSWLSLPMGVAAVWLTVALVGAVRRGDWRGWLAGTDSDA
ncbi:MAG TPA: hypothetical protein VMM93_11925 [Vicinamibacterales bacterium]|nr:hypothetical protein [Vicinamibacterales bacterium]